MNFSEKGGKGEVFLFWFCSELSSSVLRPPSQHVDFVIFQERNRREQKRREKTRRKSNVDKKETKRKANNSRIHLINPPFFKAAAGDAVVSTPSFQRRCLRPFQGQYVSQLQILSSRLCCRLGNHLHLLLHRLHFH